MACKMRMCMTLPTYMGVTSNTWYYFTVNCGITDSAIMRNCAVKSNHCDTFFDGHWILNLMTEYYICDV